MNHLKRIRNFLSVVFVLMGTILPAQYATIGTDTLSTGEYDPSPINIYYRSHRQQIVYTKAELNAAGITGGQILELGWFVVSPPIYAMPNYSISLKHDTVRDASSEIPGPFARVIEIPSYMPTAGGFDMLALDTPFIWNGVDNLVVDVCWDRVNPTYDNSGRVRYYTDSIYTTSYDRTDGSDMCGQSIYSNTSDKPHIQFLFNPAAPNDAGTVGINQGEVVCTGTQPIVVSVANWGSNQITSLSVNWSVNGVVQSPASFSGTIDTLGGSGSYTTSISLGTYTFASSGNYEIKVWTSSPNGVADTLNFNDTLVLNTSVGMAGVYTVGGTSPDYTTFTAALGDLVSNGVCDTVWIRARPGTYFERLVIPAIPGAGSSAPIYIESESGDSSTVIISHTASFSLNHVIRLNNASWLTFRNLTFEATGTSYARVLELEGTLSHIGFEHNRFLGRSGISSTSSNYNLVYYFNNDPDLYYFNFSNNRFVGGSTALYLQASSGDHLSVHDNVFEGQYNGHIYVEEINYVSIQQNDILSSSSNSYVNSIYLYDCDSSIMVIGNSVRGIRGSEGISLYDCSNSGSAPGMVANNFVQLGDPNLSYLNGLNLSYCNNFKVFYNSVNVTDGSFAARAFNLDYGNAISLYNNNFYSNSDGVVEVSGGSAIVASDFNNYFATGGSLGHWDTPIADLHALRSASGKDSNSVSLNPYFITPMGYAVAQIALDGAAMPLPEVSDDIEGDPRDAATPDIGADEFTPGALDIGAEEILTPDIPFMSGTYPVYAVVRNHGSSTVTSFTLSWEMNDVAQTPISWTGSLSSGDTAHVLLAGVNFLPGTSFDFESYTSLPNGVADPIAVNDSAVITDVLAGLGGVYTIGGLSPDFINFNEAVNALNLGGIFDSVIFQVRNGTYSEQIDIQNFPKSDSSLYVIFESENGDSSLVTLSYSTGSSNNYIVSTNGVSGLYFRDLTLHNTSSYTYNRVVYLQNGGSNIGFDRCRIIGNTYSSTSSNRALVYSSGVGPILNIHFSKVRFEGGSTALNLYFSNFSKPWNDNIEITQCLFYDQYYRAIYLYRADNVEISKNYIISGSNYYSSYTSVNLYQINGLNLTSNSILGGTSSTANGVYLYDVGPYDDGTHTLVANNFIQIGGTSVVGEGIEVDNCDTLDIFYNSVLVTNSNGSSAGLRYNYNNTNVRVLNNIFQNVGGGYSYYINSSLGLDISDHNNLYTSGPNVAYFNFTNYTDLAAWQSASGQDSNSVSVISGFTDSLDLHASSASLNAAGTPVASVTVDIDEEIRNSSEPDIGADEFDIPTDDAGILALNAPGSPLVPGSQSVLVSLLNNGADTLTNVTINWEVNGVAQSPFSWSGNLVSGGILDSLSIGTFNFLSDSLYNLKIWTSAPNGMTDALAANDTLRVNNLISGLAGVYYIGGPTPDFVDFVAAANALNNRGVVDWVNFMVANGTYTGQFSISQIEGATAEDSIAFLGANGDTSQVELYQGYTPSNTNYLLRINGTDHLSFKDLKFRRTGGYYERVIILDSGSVNLSFTNCWIGGSLYSSTTSNRALVSSFGGYSDSDISFRSCEFVNGSYGLYMLGSFGLRQTDVVVEDNLFKNQYYRGIYMSYQEDLLIQRNRITNSGNYSSYGGMALYNVLHALVDRNNIIVQNGGYYGMLLDEVDGSYG